jgi:hypothetical protein
MNGLKIGALAIACMMIITGCDLFGDDDETMDLPEASGDAVWEYLEEVNYQEDWRMWPGTGELYEGGEPHGMLLTTYMNDVAYDALMSSHETMPEGAIIVKENYTADDTTFDSATTMYKVEDYNDEFNDWFWLKNSPDGAIDAEGKVEGCQSCHQAAADNDYLFTGPLNE